MKFCLHSCLTVRDQAARHSLESQQDFNHSPNQQYRTHFLLISGSLIPGLFLHLSSTHKSVSYKLPDGTIVVSHLTNLGSEGSPQGNITL
jgi:hypothetical protein